jgi:Ca2+-dependent lipid-binding protein
MIDSVGKVTLVLHSGKIYEKQDTFSQGDPFVIVMVNEKELARSSVIENTRRPTWEESFVVLL